MAKLKSHQHSFKSLYNRKLGALIPGTKRFVRSGRFYVSPTKSDKGFFQKLTAQNRKFVA